MEFGRRRRRLVSFGILSPRHWHFTRLHPRIDRKVYDALKAVGFRETIWQFVYSGQLAGLVISRNGGMEEIHVRFFVDGIEAELEVGRRFVAHFTRPRFDASQIVLDLLNNSLLPRDLNKVRKLLGRNQGNLPITPNCTQPVLSFGILACAGASLVVVLALSGLVPSFVALIAVVSAAFLAKTLPTYDRIVTSAVAQ